MKTQRNYPVAVITEKGERKLKEGHVWVFDAEVTELIGEVENGSLVDVVNKKGRFLGTGFFNANSKPLWRYTRHTNALARN